MIILIVDQKVSVDVDPDAIVAFRLETVDPGSLKPYEAAQLHSDTPVGAAVEGFAASELVIQIEDGAAGPSLFAPLVALGQVLQVENEGVGKILYRQTRLKALRARGQRRRRFGIQIEGRVGYGCTSGQEGQKEYKYRYAFHQTLRFPHIHFLSNQIF